MTAALPQALKTALYRWDLRQAEELLADRLGQTADDTTSSLLYGTVLLAQRRPAAALAWLTRPVAEERDDRRRVVARAEALTDLGRADAAAATLAPLIKADPGFAEAWEGLARAVLALGRSDQALTFLERALLLKPNLSRAFTLDLMLRLDQALAGTVLPDRGLAAARGSGAQGAETYAEPARKVVTLSALGRYGRFGDQLGLYAAGRLLAEAAGARLECDTWVGAALYGLREPAITEVGPALDVNAPDAVAAFIAATPPPADTPPLRIDAIQQGFAPWRHRQAEARIRQWYELPEPWREPAAAITQALAAYRGPIIGVHMRLGDMAQTLPGAVPTGEDLLRCLAALWDDLESGAARPSLYLASDEPERAGLLLARFQPITAADLPISLPGGALLTDFLALCACDHLLIGPSQFGLWAALLGKPGQAVWQSAGAGAPYRPVRPWEEPLA